MSTVARTSGNTTPDIDCDMSASTTVLRKFTRFPDLPTELRLLIFSIAHPELRIYRVIRVKAIQQGQQLVFDTISLPCDRLPDIAPNLAEVCRESRKVYLKRFRNSFPLFNISTTELQPFLRFEDETFILIDNID
jgi:hypothetical protein